MVASAHPRRDAVLALLSLAAIAVLVVLFLDQFAAVTQAGGDLRTWLLARGPAAAILYVLFYAAQILIAPLPGSLLALAAGYVFGFGWGLLLSLAGLAVGASLAIWIARTLGRPLLERFFTPAYLARWERKLRLRSPLTWYVFFLFPVPDVAIYAAGLGTLPLRALLPAILLGRATSILINTALGHVAAVLPVYVVAVQWLVVGLLAVLFYRYQRPLRW